MKTYITKKQIQEFIDKVAYVKVNTYKLPLEKQECYYSKIDNSYITHVGMEKQFKMYLKYGITEQLQSFDNGNTVCVGFNPKEQKWYGWSHRAIYGFTIGSTCTKGNVHYQPDTKENFIEDCINFWKDPYHLNITTKETTDISGNLGVLISWTYSSKTPNENIRGTISNSFTAYPKSWGKGEWVAKTLADAKEMAQDFARNIS